MQLPDRSPHNPGKILRHDAGLGEASQEMIDQRARELAMIAGLPPEEATDAYRHQAREELRGAVDPTAPADDDSEVAGLEHFDDAPGESGYAASPATNAAASGDEENIGEALYGEGVAEAAHDQMVQSREKELAEGREEERAN